MSRGPLVPDPPTTLDRLATETTWPTGSALYRCHHRRLRGNSFNPSYGTGGRFHWFDDGYGTRVPVLYAAESEICAIMETIFHDVPLTGPRRFVPASHLRDKRMSQIVIDPGAPLRLVEVHDPGLTKLGLRPTQLTSTTAYHYPRTLEWARAMYEQLSWAQGLLWVSARLNTDKCLVLYGDRVVSACVSIVGMPQALDDATGSARVRDLGRLAGIDVATPAARP